jgi:hypothetical protein
MSTTFFQETNSRSTVRVELGGTITLFSTTLNPLSPKASGQPQNLRISKRRVLNE